MARNGLAGVLTSYSPSESATVAGAYMANAPLMRHKLKVYPEILASGDVEGGLHGPDAAWRKYNQTNSPATTFDMPPDHYRFTYGDQHGPTTPAPEQGEHPYYQSGLGVVNRVINYFNPGDAALNGWEFGQLTKPDFLPRGKPTWEYRNDMHICYFNAPVSAYQNGTTFEQELTRCRDTIQSVESLYSNTERSLVWDRQRTISDANHNAEILAHIIPSRTRALGQVSIAGNALGAFEVKYGTTNQGHSAQFYDTFAERQGYWRTLLSASLGFIEEEGVQSDEIFKYSRYSRSFQGAIQ
jgi:hypothetical protein